MWLGLSWLPGAGCLNPGTVPDLPATAPTPAAATSAKAELPSKDGAKVCLALAEDFEKTGHDADAIVQYERARGYDPSLKQVSRRLAILYDRLGETKKAQEEFQAALKLHPKDADLQNDFGYSCYSHGKFDEAEKHLRQALALNPKHARAWMNLGLTLGQQGRYKDSLEAFLHVASPAEAHSNLAFVLTTQGKREEAKQEYREALALDPELKIAQGALAKLSEPPGKSGRQGDKETRRQGDEEPVPPPPPPAESLPDLSPVQVPAPHG
jgi:Tfp pilus assembly protein PilF